MMKNMINKSLLLVLFVGTTLTSCVYRQYEGVLSVTEKRMPQWREVFTDPCLQALIDSTLKNNADAKTAQINIAKAETGYRTASLGYLPTLSFAPDGSVTKVGSAPKVWDYSLGLSASWQLDIFGGTVTNSKRYQKATLEYQQDYQQAVECQLISAVAQLYYQLLGLDKQLRIQRQMEALYEKTYDNARTLYEVGMYTSPAVLETKAQLDNLRAQIATLEYQIEETEHSLCKLMDEQPHDINYGNLDEIAMPDILSSGVEAEVLNNRPDVRSAERQMEMAYYNTKLKEGALYPNITLTADGGWMNPTSWFIKGVGSLVQPIFQGGRLRADLKVAKMDQQIALINFRKTVIDASHEVFTAMNSCKLAADRQPLLRSQVEALNEAVEATQELMNNGNTTYLEVIIAMERLLSARNAEVENQTEAARALVSLYGALGGR